MPLFCRAVETLSIYGIVMDAHKYSSCTDPSSTSPAWSEDVNVFVKLHSYDIKAPAEESTLKASIDHFDDRHLTCFKNRN